jgi:hypothetical protein
VGSGRLTTKDLTRLAGANKRLELDFEWERFSSTPWDMNKVSDDDFERISMIHNTHFSSLVGRTDFEIVPENPWEAPYLNSSDCFEELDEYFTEEDKDLMVAVKYKNSPLRFWGILDRANCVLKILLYDPHHVLWPYTQATKDNPCYFAALCDQRACLKQQY